MKSMESSCMMISLASSTHGSLPAKQTGGAQSIVQYGYLEREARAGHAGSSCDEVLRSRCNDDKPLEDTYISHGSDIRNNMSGTNAKVSLPTQVPNSAQR